MRSQQYSLSPKSGQILQLDYEGYGVGKMDKTDLLDHPLCRIFPCFLLSEYNSAQDESQHDTLRREVSVLQHRFLSYKYLREEDQRVAFHTAHPCAWSCHVAQYTSHFNGTAQRPPSAFPVFCLSIQAKWG